MGVSVSKMDSGFGDVNVGTGGPSVTDIVNVFVTDVPLALDPVILRR